MFGGLAIAEVTLNEHSAELETSYLHRDEATSVLFTTDSEGTSSSLRDFDVSGGPTSTPAWAQALRTSYSGHRLESNLGLIDMGVRFYDPTFGVFINPDPLRVSSDRSPGTNPFAYADNNPVSFFDPTGLQADQIVTGDEWIEIVVRGQPLPWSPTWLDVPMFQLHLEVDTSWIADLGIAAAILTVFGKNALVQRCQEHKRRNVIEHLPEHRRKYVNTMLHQAYRMRSRELAKRRLLQLVNHLKHDYPDAAASLQEGLEETLTVKSMYLLAALERTLATTNPIENLNGTIRGVTRNVKRWRDGSMIKRWVAGALIEAQNGSESYAATRVCRNSSPTCEARHPNRSHLTRGSKLRDATSTESAAPLINSERDNPARR